MAPSAQPASDARVRKHSSPSVHPALALLYLRSFQGISIVMHGSENADVGKGDGRFGRERVHVHAQSQASRICVEPEIDG
jgi:hypothetical protein